MRRLSCCCLLFGADVEAEVGNGTALGGEKTWAVEKKNRGKVS
jgi:hypothetical protein